MATAASEQKIDMGRTIQRGLDTIGHNLPAYSGLALLLAGLPAGLSNYVLMESIEGGDPAGFVSPLYWGSIFLTWLAGTLLQAAVVRSAILDLGGRPADIGGSLAAAFRLLLPLIGLTILYSIVTTIGFLLLIVPGVIVYIMLMVSVPVLVEERLGVIDSMARSRELTSGSRWRIFGLLLLFILIYFIVSALMGVAMIAISFESILAQSLVQAVSGALTALVMAAMLASLYVELRTVKEGASSENLASIFE